MDSYQYGTIREPKPSMHDTFYVKTRRDDAIRYHALCYATLCDEFNSLTSFPINKH